MRELKFRAWHEKGFIAGFNMVAFNDYCDGVEPEIYRFNSRWKISEVTIEQYTGLKDKNGVDIYEGDIVRIDTGKPMTIGWSEKFASFVIMREGWAFKHWFGEACDPSDCEVIGNIHQHPHLLEP